MEEKDILKALKEARERSKRRNFLQSWDFILNLKNIDLKLPENRLTFEFTFPNRIRKKTKVAFITEELASKAKGKVDLIIKKSDLQKMDKKKIKKYAREYDVWFAEVKLMPLVGKALGPVLGPLNKMPKPLPPNAKIDAFLQNVNKFARIRLKNSPVIHVCVGSEDMKDEDVAKNVAAFFNFVVEKLPKKMGNIKNAYIKLTMGVPVKVKI